MLARTKVTSGHYAWIGCETDVESMHVFQRRDIVPGGVCRLRVVVVVRLKSSDVGSSNPGRGRALTTHLPFQSCPCSETLHPPHSRAWRFPTERYVPGSAPTRDVRWVSRGPRCSVSNRTTRINDGLLGEPHQSCHTCRAEELSMVYLGR